jgi:hypothetical protein
MRVSRRVGEPMIAAKNKGRPDGRPWIDEERWC